MRQIKITVDISVSVYADAHIIARIKWCRHLCEGRRRRRAHKKTSKISKSNSYMYASIYTAILEQ